MALAGTFLRVFSHKTWKTIEVGLIQQELKQQQHNADKATSFPGSLIFTPMRDPGNEVADKAV